MGKFHHECLSFALLLLLLFLTILLSTARHCEIQKIAVCLLEVSIELWIPLMQSVQLSLQSMPCNVSTTCMLCCREAVVRVHFCVLQRRLTRQKTA